jgi:hypothetical protein
MTKTPKDKQAQILKELKSIRKVLEHQKTPKRVFMHGIIHGIAFFIGSAIIATILLGIFGPYFAEIDWIAETYIQGTELK